jgi:DNA-binding transcriptional ArsR family regulator
MSDVDGNKQNIVAMANCLRIVSHPSRLAIVLFLLDGSSTVSGIEQALGLRQPNLSQHLGVLRDAQLLTATRHAKSVVYEVAEGKTRAIAVALRSCLERRDSDIPPVEPTAAAVSVEVPRKYTPGESDEALLFAQVFTHSAKVRGREET